jgi:uncharacterized membrane protein YqiK
MRCKMNRHEPIDGIHWLILLPILVDLLIGFFVFVFCFCFFYKKSKSTTFIVKNFSIFYEDTQ